MPFQPSPRLLSVLASALAASLMLAVASCGHVAPLGPAPPKPSHLKSAFVLQAMRIQPPAPAGGCPAGFTTLSAPGATSGACYRKLGTPVAITSAAVSSVSSIPAQAPPGQAPPGQAPPGQAPPGQQAGPAQYGFTITLPAAEMPELTAVTTTAADVKGPLALSIASRTWVLPIVVQPFPGPRFWIMLAGRNQAVQLQRLLVPSG